jgi:filamentous hemagglutinin family protein
VNKNAHRLIFSRSRGMLIAVAETVVGHGKGSTPAKARQGVAIGSVFKFFPLKATSLSACLLIGYALQMTQAQNLPTGGKVVGGTASIAQPSANKMVVTQSTEKAAVNWNTLNVGSGDTLQFVQPSANSQVLNRVVGVSGSSQILGTLTANGQVYIVNPQGVVFGNGASVNVGSILASTRDISPSAFMAGGSLEFSAGANASGLISNEGSITASAGYIVLAADKIRNTGTLNAPAGQVMLTAGDQATLSLSNGQLVRFTVNATADNLSISNGGVIQAQDGKIVLNTNATNNLLNSVINLSGVVSAQGGAVAIDSGATGSAALSKATVDVSRQGGPAGNITVSAKDIKVAANSRLLASGTNGKGGKVVLAGNTDSGNSQVTVIDSTVNVSGVNSGSSGAESSRGGTVILSGNRVDLSGNTTIDASGVAGGGQVIVGGDLLGKAGNLAPVPLANQTYIGSNVSIEVGSSAGDGGFVETSGKQITVLGNVKGSSKGKNGEWLIDPTDIVITNQTNTTGANGSNTTNSSNASNLTSNNSANVSSSTNNTSGNTSNTTSNILNTSINNALSNGTNVTVTTASNGSAGGNLTVEANLTVTNPGNTSLTLLANQSLTFNQVNISASGNGTLGLNATSANGTLTVNSTNFSLNGGSFNLTGISVLLPTGGQVVGGDASIAQPSANRMVVTQTTDRAALNWNTFDVGSGNTLQFVQPSSGSQVLNRVVGVSGSSQILGTLTANGQVFIVNPQGVVFGNGAMVNVGSILAGTRDIAPSEFMLGGPLKYSDTSNASGSISNEGTITANSGFVVLAADQVAVADSAINVSGVNASSRGGTVILAGNRVGVLGNSTINASGMGGGGAVIIGGDQLGKVTNLTPVVLANQTYIGSNVSIQIGSGAGDGGFVETSGQTLTMLGNVKGASKGKNAEWLIDPTNITINSAISTNVTNASNVWTGNNTSTGNVLNTSITNALSNGTSVTVTTVSSGPATGTLTVAADLIVNNPQNSTLTLFANQSLTFGAFNVCATGTGTLGLNATAANGTLTINGTSFDLNGGTATLSGNASTVNSVNIIGNVAFNGNDRIDITGSSIGALQGVYQTGNLTQVNGTTNIVGGNRDGSGNGVWIAGNITQNSGALNIAGVNTNSTGNGVKFHGTNATTGLVYLNQTGGSINITGNSMNTNTNSHGVHLNYVSLNQTSGTLNITGNSDAANALLIGNSFLTINSSLNLSGTSNTSLGVLLSITNVTQNNGSINITGISNSGLGVRLQGNTTQTSGALNIIGTSNAAIAVDHRGNTTQTSGALNIIGTSKTNNGVSLSGNLTQTNGYINLTGVSSSGNGMTSENMTLTQNGGIIFINGTTNTSGSGFNFYNSNITQNNGSISLIGQTQNVSYDGGYLPVTTIIQNNGSMNIVGSGGGGLRFTNVIQNNGSLNIAGNGTAARSGIELNGNLSQTNGSINITGSGNTSTGVKFVGNLNQTNGTLNITGGSNYSSGISLGSQTALGTNNTFNSTTGLWTNVTTAVNTTNTSNYSTFTNGVLTNTTALGAFNLTVANGNNLLISGNSVNGTGIEVVGLSNLNITAGTLLLNGSISSSQGSGVRLSGSQTNTTRVVTTGANTTTTTTNQSNATALNLLGAGNVTFVGSSASGAGVYLAGGNVTLNNAGTGSLNLNGISTSGRGVQLGGVTHTTNTNTSAVNSTAGGSNTTTNSSTQIGPSLNLIVAGSGSDPSLVGTSNSGIGAYLGNVTFAGSVLNISGSSTNGAGVQVGGLNSVLAMPTTAVSNSSTSTVSGTVTTNTTTNVSLLADTTGNVTIASGSLNIINTNPAPDAGNRFAAEITTETPVSVSTTPTSVSVTNVPTSESVQTIAAEVLPQSVAETIASATASSAYALQGMTSMGTGGTSTSSASTSSTSSTSTTQQTSGSTTSSSDSTTSSSESTSSGSESSSQSTAGSTTTEDTQSTSAGGEQAAVSVAIGPGGDVAIPNVPMISLNR